VTPSLAALVDTNVRDATAEGQQYCVVATVLLISCCDCEV